MPHFEYQCSRGHVTGLFRSVEQRPLAVKCAACGEEAKQIMSLPQRPVVRGGTPKHHRRGEP